MERTVLILKPAALEHRRVGQVLSRVEDFGFVVEEAFTTEVTFPILKKFYLMQSEEANEDTFKEYDGETAMVLSLSIDCEDIASLIGVTDIEKNFPVRFSRIHNEEVVKFWFG